MTAELHSADQSQPIPLTPEMVRLSFLGNHTQVDVALPLDVPIATVVPRLVALTRTPNGVSAGSESAESPDERARRTVWTVSRLHDSAALAPSSTLRQAGVADGELLRLDAAPAQTEFILYDDVVDATAHFHKAGHAAWDAEGARWMAFAGTFLSAAVWVYVLLAGNSTHDRVPLIGLAVIVSMALAGAAALAQRSYARSDIAAVLGWAALLIESSAVWPALRGLGIYGPPAACLVALVATAALHSAIGTGVWGYLATGVVFSVVAVALLAHAVGLRIDIAGAGLALLSIVCLPAVPALTVRLTRSGRARSGRPGDAPVAEAELTGNGGSVATQDVWTRLRSATLTRSALYTGLSISAAVGAVLVLTSHGPRWSGLMFVWGCVTVLWLQSLRPRTVLERAGLALPAAAVMLGSCFLAQQGRQPLPLLTYAVLLTAIIVSAAAATVTRPQQLPGWVETAWAYSNYLTAAALMPLALWVIEDYSRLSAA